MSRRPENLGALLLRAYRWFDVGLVEALNAAGWPHIRRPHSLVFGHLDLDGTRPAEIARRIGITRQAVNQTLRELEGMGLVRQIPDPSDRRATLVVATRRGRESTVAALRAFADLERDLARRIGLRRVADLRRTLETDWGSAGSAGRRTEPSHPASQPSE